MGRGLGEKRCVHAGRDHQIPRLGVDCWHITSGGLNRRTELEAPETPEGDVVVTQQRIDGNLKECIVMRCYVSKGVFGHAVPCKGPGEDTFVVGLIVGAVTWLGHVRLITKTDQERSLVSLAKQALQSIRVQVEGFESASLEHSQAYDSQASGGTEVGVLGLRGQFECPTSACRTGWVRSSRLRTRSRAGFWSTRRCSSTASAAAEVASRLGHELGVEHPDSA